MSAEEISGEDVIGVQGQNLTKKELRYIVGLADGETPSVIGQALQMPTADLRFVEAQCQAKLGAKTRSHLISRAFLLGVLLPRAFMGALLFIFMVSRTDHDAQAMMPPTANAKPLLNLDEVDMAGTSRVKGMNDPRYDKPKPLRQ